MAETTETTQTPTPQGAATAPPPPAAPKKPKQLKKSADDPGVWRTGRRDFLQAFGWLGFVGFLLTATVGALRMMFPRILFEKPPQFKAGAPNDYIPNTVNEKYKESQRVWIVRDTERIVAISAICTHLGCTPRWLSD
jgi:cytochrome b6-f complex iron-sulfur subunit